MENQSFTNSFKRKEDKYFANLINIYNPTTGEIVWGKSMSGVKGMFATTRLIYPNATLQKRAELFAVSSEYIESSY